MRIKGTATAHFGMMIAKCSSGKICHMVIAVGATCVAKLAICDMPPEALRLALGAMSAGSKYLSCGYACFRPEADMRWMGNQ